MRTILVLVAFTGLLVPACSGAIADDGARKGTAADGTTPRADAGGADASATSSDATDAGTTPIVVVGEDAGGGDACLADCRARFPGGVSASSLILYSCGTTCGTNGACGTQNLFGSSTECSSCMLSSTSQSCVAAFDMCNTDKVCAAFSACVRDCEK